MIVLIESSPFIGKSIVSTWCPTFVQAWVESIPKSLLPWMGVQPAGWVCWAGGYTYWREISKQCSKWLVKLAKFSLCSMSCVSVQGSSIGAQQLSPTQPHVQKAPVLGNWMLCGKYSQLCVSLSYASVGPTNHPWKMVRKWSICTEQTQAFCLSLSPKQCV